MGCDPGMPWAWVGSGDVGAAHMGGHARDSPLAAVAGREAAAREQGGGAERGAQVERGVGVGVDQGADAGEEASSRRRVEVERAAQREVEGGGGGGERVGRLEVLAAAHDHVQAERQLEARARALLLGRRRQHAVAREELLEPIGGEREGVRSAELPAERVEQLELEGEAVPRQRNREVLRLCERGVGRLSSADGWAG